MKTAERVVTVFNYLAQSQEDCSITEISKQLALSKSTVYRILSALKGGRWVAQNSKTGKYSLGSRMLELGVSMLSRFSLIRDCVPYLEQLRNATGETAILHIRDHLERIVVEQVQGYETVRYLAEPGERLPLWCTAPSKAILAFMEEDEKEAVIDELVRSGVSALPSGQAVDVGRLREELADIGRKRFAVSVGERVPEAFAIAAPIFGRDGRVVGSISISGPVSRFSADIATKYSPLIVQITRELSLRLGSLRKC